MNMWFLSVKPSLYLRVQGSQAQAGGWLGPGPALAVASLTSRHQGTRADTERSPVRAEVKGLCPVILLEDKQARQKSQT